MKRQFQSKHGISSAQFDAWLENSKTRRTPAEVERLIAVDRQEFLEMVETSNKYRRANGYAELSTADWTGYVLFHSSSKSD